MLLEKISMKRMLPGYTIINDLLGFSYTKLWNIKDHGYFKNIYEWSTYSTIYKFRVTDSKNLIKLNILTIDRLSVDVNEDVFKHLKLWQAASTKDPHHC